jgi:peptide/nickel transport system substrate-binding protein
MRRTWPLIIVLGLVFAACTPAPAPAPGQTTGAQSQPAEKRSSNQVLRMTDTGMPASMSPESSVGHITFTMLYDQLVLLDNKFNVIPWVATSWEQTNPTTWRVHLRNDMTFANGDKLTANDVKFTIDYFLSAKTPQATRFPTLTEIKVVDDYTFDFLTKTPDASVPVNLIYVYIMPKNYFQQVGKDGFVAKPMGSGPYQLAEFRSGDLARFTLRSEPHAFRKPIATEVVFRVLPEATSTMAGMQTGDLDIVLGQQFTADQLDGLAKAGATIKSKPNGTLNALFPQPESKARNLPTLDKRVRQAINYAVNKDALNQTFYRGAAPPAGQIGIPDTPFYDPTIQPYPYDPAKAKQLLADAGYPNGFKFPVGLDFTPYSANGDMMLAIQSDLRNVGIELAVNSYELGTFLDKFYSRNGQTKGDLMVAVANEGDGLSTTSFGLYSCNKPPEAIWWCNADFDKYLGQMINEPDPAKRPALGHMAAQAQTADVPNLYLLHTPRYIVTGKNIRGFDFPASNIDLVYRVE